MEFVTQAVQLAGSLEKFTGVAPKWLRDRLLAAIADIDEGQLSSKQAKVHVLMLKIYNLLYRIRCQKYIHEICHSYV